MKKYYPENHLIFTEENKNALSSKATLKEAYYSGKILEARAALCDKEHNLHVDLGVMKGIIPRKEGAIGIDDGSVRDIAVISRVNKPVVFKIIDFKTDESGETYAVLSRRAVQQECLDEYTSKLTPGCVIDAVVTEEKTALSAISGSLPVFATPFLVALMEQAASELSEKEVEEGFTTVGTEISVSHLAPSVVGAQVRAVATLVKKEERKLFFFVEAFDDKGKIGEGEHTRFIVNKEKFMKKAHERKA